jgi:hypothetical protein
MGVELGDEIARRRISVSASRSFQIALVLLKAFGLWLNKELRLFKVTGPAIGAIRVKMS